MGTLMYGAGIEVAIDDRTLAHLQIVITGKLRRGECFFFNWHDSAAVGGGRSAIWLSRATPVQFHLQEQEKVGINREWLDLLMTSANSSTVSLTGLRSRRLFRPRHTIITRKRSIRASVSCEQNRNLALRSISSKASRRH